jgi:hypothetical protein
MSIDGTSKILMGYCAAAVGISATGFPRARLANCIAFLEDLAWGAVT